MFDSKLKKTARKPTQRATRLILDSRFTIWRFAVFQPPLGYLFDYSVPKTRAGCDREKSAACGSEDHSRSSRRE